MRGVVLGPQQLKSTLGEALQSLDCEGDVALVTAGWQERESQDEEVAAQLGRRCINLNLYQRAERVFAEDPEFAAMHRARQNVLRERQEFYRLRLERTFQAAIDISRRSAGSDLEADEARLSMESVRALDMDHLRRCNALRAEFEEETQPLQRPAVVRHRDDIAEVLRRTSVIAIAGGHVAILLNRLRMFGVSELLAAQAQEKREAAHQLVAWSGGAMVTGERVVLFHESPPQGFGISEVMDAGLGLHRGILPLPDPKRRLQLGDPFRVSWLARRYEHTRCVTFDHGEWVRFDGVRWLDPHGTLLMQADGSVNADWVQ